MLRNMSRPGASYNSNTAEALKRTLIIQSVRYDFIKAKIGGEKDTALWRFNHTMRMASLLPIGDWSKHSLVTNRTFNRPQTTIG